MRGIEDSIIGESGRRNLALPDPTSAPFSSFQVLEEHLTVKVTRLKFYMNYPKTEKAVFIYPFCCPQSKPLSLLCFANT